MSEPYNPLDKPNIAKSIKAELLERPIDPLSAIDHVAGAGAYVIYYRGPFPAYAPIAAANEREFVGPIYVGKAIPKGGRKGGASANASLGRALADRLRQHAASISECVNLEVSDFHVRYLMVDDIWIPLGENVLIETFQPVWNIAVDGFGNKDPGRRRASQYKSPWDVLHPGRQFAEKLADSPVTAALIAHRIEDHFAGRALTKLPREIAEEQAVEEVLQELDEGDVET